MKWYFLFTLMMVRILFEDIWNSHCYLRLPHLEMFWALYYSYHSTHLPPNSLVLYYHVPFHRWLPVQEFIWSWYILQHVSLNILSYFLNSIYLASTETSLCYFDTSIVCSYNDNLIFIILHNVIDINVQFVYSSTYLWIAWMVWKILSYSCFDDSFSVCL